MKRVRKYSSWEEQPANDLAYWLTRTPMQRLQAVQFLRQQRYLISPPPVEDGRRVRKFSRPVE